MCTILAASLAVYAQASGQFILTWLQRERGMTYGGAAIMGGWLYLIGGTLGSFCGGLLSDWFHRVLPSGGRLWFLVCVNIVFAPVGALFYLSDVNSLRFQLLWAATSFGFMVWYGAAYSTVQELAPPRSRATAIALMIFSVNFLGAGPGPWVTGWLGANLERILSEQGVLARLITPVLDWFHIEPTQGFTFALLLSVGVAFLGLPLNMIAAIRYRRDLELVTDVFPAGHANMGGTTPTTGA